MKFELLESFRELLFREWVLLGIAAALAAVLAVLVVRSRRTREREAAPVAPGGARALVYGALLVAVSFVLSYLRLLSMPQGGAITLASVLPLALYAYWFGPRNGIVAGLAAGVLQFLQEPVVVHWAQPLLDYILAFGCFGLAGFFRSRQRHGLALGLLVGGLGRVVCSTLSGVIFFAEYAPQGMNVWVYSLGYNLGYLGPDLLIALLVAWLPPLHRLFQRVRPV